MAEPPDLRGAIAVEAVEWSPGDDDKVTIVVRGRWRRRRPALSGQPVLVIEAEGQRHRFPATPEPPSLGGAPPGGWQMTFTVPEWLAPHLRESAWLQLGLTVMPLPRAVGPLDRPVDPETLTERRARTAELAVERARTRVSEAEAVVAELTIRVEQLERSLEHARLEPVRLRELIAERDRQRRIAEQRAHAEYAQRLELEEAIAAARRGEHRERRIQQGELAAAEDRVRELEQEVEHLRRQLHMAEELAAAPLSPVSPGFDLERELEVAAMARAQVAPAPGSGRGSPGPAELDALGDELRAREAAKSRAIGRDAPVVRQPQAPSEDDDAGSLASVLSELRHELEQLSAAAVREAGARTLAEERVRELERRVEELEQQLRDRDARAQRAFETVGELRELLARAAGRDLEPVLSEEQIDPEPAGGVIELERFDAALARLRAEAGEPDEDRGSEPAAAPVGAATRPWLREAFAMLAARDPASAGELLVGLLSAQGAVRQEPVAYDVALTPEDVVQVTSAGAGAPPQLVRTGSARDLGQVAVRISGNQAELARLMVAGPLRRLILRRGLPRVQGNRGALSALSAILDTRLDLAQLHAAGARLDPRLALTLAASMVRPSWTVGERFTIAYASPGPDAAAYIHVRDGEPLAVSDDPPLGPVATTVSSPAEQLLAVLAGDPSADVSVSGDPAALLALVGWLERAQRG